MSNSVLDAVLSQYEKNTSGSSNGGNRMSQEERMKRYFTTILDKNQKSASRRIRILPTTDGSSPFKEVWYHEVQVNGQWQKFYDPGKNDNERSPLSEVYEELMNTGREADKELAKQYKPRKFYIVKLIDRDNEDDGVKFWRFKHNYKNEGILDKLIPIFRAKGDVTDAQKGRDIILEMTKAKTPKGATYTVIQTIMYDDPAPIHEDKETADGWVNDELSWADVYSKKPVEYLEAIAKGETPRWDSEKGGYVYSNSDSGEVVLGGKSTPTYLDNSDDFERSGDLPF